MNQVTAKLNYLKISPRKVRLVANTLKKLPVNEAEAQLLIRTKRAAVPLLKLLRSAVANAKNKKIDPQKLVINSILVNEGPMLKRFLPRAQGRATPIHKKTSHVTLILSETEKPITAKFNILPPVKKEKKKKEKTSRQARSEKPKATEVKEVKPVVEEKPGFFKRIFRRKSV